MPEQTGVVEGQCKSEAHSLRAFHDAALLVLADTLDDLEKARIAAENRLRSLTTVKGMSSYVDGGRLAGLVQRLQSLEDEATLELKRAMRVHPLGPWIKGTVGIGEKQGARLLAVIGDPADRPNVAKLWAYCGHGDSRRSRLCKENVRIDSDGRPRLPFSPIAKMRIHLIARSCIKQAHSPYREVYDRERARWLERDTTDGHKHNHALRVVGKEILRDLWVEARRLRGQAARDTHQDDAPTITGHSNGETQSPPAGTSASVLPVRTELEEGVHLMEAVLARHGRKAA